MRLTVQRSDGRVLEALDSGVPGGFPVVYHHGTPQGAVPMPMLERAGRERGLRLIYYSRPGYGGSSPRPDDAAGAAVADDAADTAAILDHLGIDEFVAIGWSGGGPRALACAALLPGRCRAAACCVGIAPRAEFDGDIRDGMGEENVEEYTAAFAGPEELAAFLEPHAGVLSATAEEIADSLGGLVPPVDKAAITGELAEYLAAASQVAGRQGIVGWLQDDLTHVRPWGFAMADIAVPVSVWQGRHDLMVPFRHAEWLAAAVPGARRYLVDDEGHLSLFSRMGDIVDDLLDMAGVTV